MCNALCALSKALCGLTHVSIYDRLLPTIWAQTDFVRGELTRNARKAKIKGLIKGSQAQDSKRISTSGFKLCSSSQSEAWLKYEY